MHILRTTARGAFARDEEIVRATSSVRVTRYGVTDGSKVARGKRGDRCAELTFNMQQRRRSVEWDTVYWILMLGTIDAGRFWVGTLSLER